MASSSGSSRVPPEPHPIPCVGSDDEESFVVLCGGALCDELDSGDFVEASSDLMKTEIVHNMQDLITAEIKEMESAPSIPEVKDINDLTKSLSSIVIGSDWSLEETRKQVQDIISENNHLKGIIAQNNLNLKNQHDKILAWKDEVDKLYKDKSLAVKKLKEENSVLSNEVDKYRHIKQLQDEEIINLKDMMSKLEHRDEAAHGSEVNLKEFELQTVKLKNTELETTVEKLRIALTTKTAEYERLSSFLARDTKFEEQLKSAQGTIEELQLKLKLQESQAAEAREVLSSQVKELELLLQKQTGKEEVNTVNMESELQSKQMQIDEINEENDKLRERIVKLEEAHCDRVQKLQNKILSLKSAANTCGSEEQLQQMRVQLSFVQKKNAALEEEKEKLLREIENGRKLLQETGCKDDEMFALKEQLELYKGDFEMERESKSALQRENDQMRSDIENLHRRNEQLQSELEKSRPVAPPEQPKSIFLCPKCSFKFNTYDSLENHVHRCLDLD